LPMALPCRRQHRRSCVGCRRAREGHQQPEAPHNGCTEVTGAVPVQARTLSPLRRGKAVCRYRRWAWIVPVVCGSCPRDADAGQPPPERPSPPRPGARSHFVVVGTRVQLGAPARRPDDRGRRYSLGTTLITPPIGPSRRARSRTADQFSRSQPGVTDGRPRRSTSNPRARLVEHQQHGSREPRMTGLPTCSPVLRVRTPGTWSTRARATLVDAPAVARPRALRSAATKRAE